MKKLNVYLLIGTIFVIITGTISHFVYELSGSNLIIGLFFPVNESTWEHMKLIFFPMLICALFLNWQLKKEYPCITCALHFGILLGTFLIPVIFYTYSGILGTNLTVLDISTFIISVTLVTHYLNKTCNRHSNDNCTKHNPVPSEYCKIVFFDEAHQELNNKN